MKIYQMIISTRFLIIVFITITKILKVAFLKIRSGKNLLDENENLSIFPLIGSKECAGMVRGWASRKCAWRYSNGSQWRLNDAF